MEEILMIQPRSPDECGVWVSIWAVECFMPSQTPRVLMEMVRSKWETGVSWIRCVTPEEDSTEMPVDC